MRPNAYLIYQLIWGSTCSVWFDREKSKELGEIPLTETHCPHPKQTALYEGIQAVLHSFAASGLDGGKWLAWSPGLFTPGTHWKTRTPQQRRRLQRPVPVWWKSLPNHRAETETLNLPSLKQECQYPYRHVCYSQYWRKADRSYGRLKYENRDLCADTELACCSSLVQWLKPYIDGIRVYYKIRFWDV
jgi:hypothetical protein